jgi:MerR, DNA binding
VLLRGTRPAPNGRTDRGPTPLSRIGSIGHVGIILLLGDVGFTLAERKVFMASRGVALDDWQPLARRKLAELDDQIAKAQTAREAVDHALRCPHEDILECPTSPVSPPPASPVNRSTKPTDINHCTRAPLVVPGSRRPGRGR